MKRESNESAREGGSGGRRAAVLTCLALVAAGASAVLVIFNTQPTAQREGAVRESAMLVDTAQPASGSFRPVILATGTVRPSRDITLRPRVGGAVVEISEEFVPGGSVEAGDVLVRLDDDDYRTALAELRSELQQAQAELDIEVGRREQAESELQQFGRDLSAERRARVLREPQRRSAEAVVEAARAALARAELDLERATIAAPFDAQVLSRSVNLGSQVSAGDALGRLVGTDTYWVEVSIPMAKLPWLELPAPDQERGSQVTLRNRTAWPDGMTRRGHVFRLVGELDPQTRMARLLVAVDDPLARERDEAGRALIIGEYLQVMIEGRELQDVVRLDREHLRDNDTVWVMRDGRLNIQPVDVVFEDERHAYISAGLSAGDRVVTSRLATVEEGVRLREDDDGRDSS